MSEPAANRMVQQQRAAEALDLISESALKETVLRALRSGKKCVIHQVMDELVIEEVA